MSTGGTESFLVPSQVTRRQPSSRLRILHDDDRTVTGTEDHAPQEAETTHVHTRNRRPRKKKSKRRQQQQASGTPPVFATEGNAPDIYWRTVPMEHLRLHPHFRPLPSFVEAIDNLSDVRLYRQDSWEWQALHAGRCTTSQASAALGFRQPIVGQLLQIPRSWCGAGARMGPYRRLREPALRTLQDIQGAFAAGGNEVDKQKPCNDQLAEETVWATGSKFVVTYQADPAIEEVERRQRHARAFGLDHNMGNRIRMMWGNTQESTALLTALNFFLKEDPGVMLDEVGMCGADVDVNHCEVSSSLIIGASPDGVLRYSDGHIEALEVKNHCPFITWRPRKGKRNNKHKLFLLGQRAFDVESNGRQVFSHYISQLQMEMLCLGPECRSAVMVRQTATKGALVLRMHRDDKWIEEMLYWLHQFQACYVEKNIPPKENFFWDNPSDHAQQARYRRFVSWTQKLDVQRVEVVAHIPHHDIQRPHPRSSLFMD